MDDFHGCKNHFLLFRSVWKVNPMFSALVKTLSWAQVKFFLLLKFELMNDHDIWFQKSEMESKYSQLMVRQ